MIAISKQFRRHVLALLFRALLLAAALWLYVTDRQKLDFTAPPRPDFGGFFLCAVWLLLVFGMLLRLVPNRRAALGARKHFACAYRAAPSGGDAPLSDASARRLHRGAAASALAWILLSAAVFLVLSLLKLLTPAAVMLLLLAYGVCDLVCILFFCPFQVFFMKNRCCVVCRIYNWDCFMMCTPLLPYPSVYSLTLLLLSAAVLLRWELALRKNPRYFSDETNESLRCSACGDRVCLLRGKR